jgi:PPOX class probable F420-dependent enzyme
MGPERDGLVASMEIDDALTFLREHRNGVLTTIKRDGRPQSSNIIYAVQDDGTIGISVTASRAKTRNAARDPRVSLHVSRDDFYAYVVLEGDAELSPVSTEPGDAAGELLADLYRKLIGEHENWDEYFQAMVTDQRQVLTIRPTHAYGMLPS